MTDIPTDTPMGSAWEAFEREVMSPETGSDEREAQRIAFYTGAAVVMALLAKNVDEDKPDAAMALVDTLNDELGDFGEALDRAWLMRHTGTKQ